MYRLRRYRNTCSNNARLQQSGRSRIDLNSFSLLDFFANVLRYLRSLYIFLNMYTSAVCPEATIKVSLNALTTETFSLKRWEFLIPLQTRHAFAEQTINPVGHRIKCPFLCGDYYFTDATAFTNCAKMPKSVGKINLNNRKIRLYTYFRNFIGKYKAVHAEVCDCQQEEQKVA